MNRIVVTFLVSYDAGLLKTSLPLVYDWADVVVLAIDRERRTWQGNRFDLPSGFLEWTRSIDCKSKIVVYEDAFYIPGTPPLELDCRQRQMAVAHAGIDSTWHVQVDADEYVLNFGHLVADLRREESRGGSCHDVLYMGKLVPLFKQDARGFFYVDNGATPELVALAATEPHYVAARKTRCKTHRVFDVTVIHQTFARPESELLTKLENWGHSNDFDTRSYLNLWRAVDSSNFHYLADFHPSYRPTWRRLAYIEASTLQEFITKYCQQATAAALAPKQNQRRQSRLRRLYASLRRRILR